MDITFGKAYHNLSVPSPVEVTIKRKEGLAPSNRRSFRENRKVHGQVT